MKALRLFAAVALLWTLPLVAENTYTADQAKSHVGGRATVCGVVASAHFAASTKGQPTFLNLDKPLAVIGMLGTLSLQAQVVRHPGDIIKFQIKFDGSDADKIFGHKIHGIITTLTEKSSDQSGFRSRWASEKHDKEIAPGIFSSEFKIPDDIATGDYFLSIAVYTEPGALLFKAGYLFQLYWFRIENPKTLSPPVPEIYLPSEKP